MTLFLQIYNSQHSTHSVELLIRTWRLCLFMLEASSINISSYGFVKGIPDRIQMVQEFMGTEFGSLAI